MLQIYQYTLLIGLGLTMFFAIPFPNSSYEKNQKRISFHDLDKSAKQTSRIEALRNMEKVMGKLPSRANLPPLDIIITDSLQQDSYTRYSLTFAVTSEERLPVYLYVPKKSGRTRKFPAMLVLHGTNALGKGVVDGQGDKPNRAHAKELAERGYVVIAPDYPSFGDLTDHNFETDRYESATMQGIFNHMRSVDLLQSRKDVDPEKIGALGLSLGGHNSMFVAAFDPRIKVCVSASGWTQLEYYDIGEEMSKRYGGRLGPWAQTRYMPLWKDRFGLDGKVLPFNFDQVIAAIAPRAFFSVSPLNDANFDVKGVREGIKLAQQAYTKQNAGGMLQVRYPDAGHDFPVESRREAYAFVDRILQHQPRITDLK